MPIFEYRCRECGENFEAIVKSSSVRVACTSCGGKKVEQKLATFYAVTSKKSWPAATASESVACVATKRAKCYWARRFRARL